MMTEHDVLEVLIHKHLNVYEDIVVYNTHVLPWESDVLRIRKSGIMEEYEIKVSRADFKVDHLKSDKHRIIEHGQRMRNGEDARVRPLKKFWYVVPLGIVDRCRPLLPAYAGLMAVDPSKGRYGRVAVVVDAPTLAKARKATDAEIKAAYRSMYYRAWNAKRFVWRRRRPSEETLVLPGLE